MSEQPQYQPGQIVNGHVWTGTHWLPLQPDAPKPAGSKPPLSQRFDELPRTRKLLLMAAIGIGGTMAVLLTSYVSGVIGL